LFRVYIMIDYKRIPLQASSYMSHLSYRLFNGSDMKIDESKYEKLFKKYEKEFYNAINELLDLWNTKEHKQTLWHDNIHITYDLLEFLYLIKNVDLKKSEQYLILFGSLLHDLWRYPELLLENRSWAMDFNKVKEIQLHAALSWYIWIMLARKFKSSEDDSDIVQTSIAFNKRVIWAVLFHWWKNGNRDPIGHHVQSIDRLAWILWVREFVRNILTDWVQRWAQLYPDERLSYAEKFPLFNNLPVSNFTNSDTPEKSWTNIVHYLEMPMRNIYPLSSDFWTERAKKMRRESGLILTLLSWWEWTKLYDEIFAPELNLDKTYNFPKTRLQDDIWKSIKLWFSQEEIEKMKEYESLEFSDLVYIMLKQQSPNIQESEKQKVQKLLKQVPIQHKEDIKKAIIYVVSRYELNKHEEKKFLTEQSRSQDSLISTLSKRLLNSPLFWENDVKETPKNIQKKRDVSRISIFFVYKLQLLLILYFFYFLIGDF
jgi:hypothetical protein